MEYLNLSRYNDVCAIEELLNKGVDVNFQDFDGATALQFAAANDYRCLVDILIKNGADINCANNYGWTPLMHSSYNGHFGMVDYLLEHGANYTCQNKLGLTATIIAACCGHLSIVKLLLSTEESKNQVASTQSCELSVLTGAVLFGKDEIVTFLIQKGMDLNQSTKTGKLSPLMLASCLGQLGVVKILMESGADSNLVNICHKTALQMSAVCGQWEIQMFLKDKMPFSMTLTQTDSQSEMQLLDATCKGDIELMKDILKSHSDLNMTVPSFGKGLKLTPLMQAAVHGYVEAVSILIKHGANIDIQDTTKGFTALMYAVYYNKPEVVKILLKAGASVDIQSTGGFSALDLAWIQNEKSEIVELLLSKKRKKSTLAITGALESGVNTPKSRRKSSGLLRKDSIRRIVDNLAVKFQNMRKSSTAPTTPKSPQTFCQEYSYTQYTEDENVFMDSQDSGSSRFSGKSSGTLSAYNNILKLSSCHFPQLDKSLFRNEDDLKPISPLFKPNFSSSPNIPNIENKIISSNMPSKLCASRCSMVYSFVYKLQLQKKILHHKYSKELAFLDEDKSTSLAHVLGIQKKSFKNSFHKRQTTSIKTGSDHVRSILHKLSLNMYTNVFIDNEVDFETLKAITEDDLHEMGVIHPEHCQKLLNFISMNY